MVIEKRGKNYRIVIYCGSDHNGRAVRMTKTYKPAPGLSDRAAKKAAYNFGMELENRIKQGQNIKYDNLSFNDFAKMYFDNYAPRLKAYTAAQYKDIYEKRLKDYFGNMKIINISPLDIIQWLTALDKRTGNNNGDLSENSKGAYFRTLSALFGVAVKWGVINNNPCKRVTAPRSQTKVKALEKTEVNRLFDNIDNYPDPRAVVLVYLFILTGVRLSEAAGLVWDDINFQDKIIHINREALYIPGEKAARITPPKSANSNRDIFIPELLCEKLKEYKVIQDRENKQKGDLFNDNGFLFTQFNGAPVHASTIRKWIKKAFDFCGVDYITVHGLRHTFASLLISNGIDARTTAAQLGHSAPALVMNIYANPQNEAKRRAAAMIEKVTTQTDKKSNSPQIHPKTEI